MNVEILVEGPWTREQVQVVHTNVEWSASASMTAEIDRRWAAAMAEKGRSLFDGPMARVDRMVAREGSFELDVSRTSYKSFFTVHFSELKSQFENPSDLPNPLGVSVALESADGQLLFGRRGNRVAYYPNRIHPFAGTMEPVDRDMFETALRELEEEAHLPASAVEESVLLGMVQDPTIRQPEAVVWVRTSRTAEEVRAGLDPQEHDGMVAVPINRAEVEENPELMALFSSGELTPVCEGTILLWGMMER